MRSNAKPRPTPKSPPLEGTFLALNDIPHAVNLLNAGELVAFPTETVYGLGADATNSEAVKKIFAAKGRPADHPVIVHIAEFAQLTEWVKDIPATANIFAKHFWPGAMTLIFPVADHVSAFITGGQNTIGIRMPSHPIARELLLAFGKGIAAPSANRFGRISSTSAAHVKAAFGNEVALILDGGECPVGIESTIIDVTQDPPCLLRPGPLNILQIAEITGITLTENQKHRPRVSGSLASHYAPLTPVKLLAFTSLLSTMKTYSKAGIISFHKKPENDPNIIWLTMPNHAGNYATKLYAALHELDAKNLDIILIEQPPLTVEWQAVNDRLRRASY